ncbi:MAG: hypothetical protein H6Q66_396 [Firmicutes bacterium]|nr:hypothetical protein [Bacillota bacterium]
MMRYFSYLSSKEEQAIFFLSPKPICVNDRETMEYALGAALYMPGTRLTVAKDIIDGKLNGLMTMVLCLEDAIGDSEVAKAEKLLVCQLQELAQAVERQELAAEAVPLIFIRIREASQMQRVCEALDNALPFLTGFIFPKFQPSNAQAYLETLSDLNKKLGQPLYGMPILESREMIYRENRWQNLTTVKSLLGDYRRLILNIRIGATDFSGLFGLRRNPDLTIYDIAPIRDCIADIVNIFCRPEDPYVVSGPVWEFYSSERVLKPQLRQTPFTDSLGQAGGRLRSNMVCRYIDGLIHEVLLDKANGLVGKTIIHPTHIKPVQSLCVVTHEEYSDALNILQGNSDERGVMASSYANKMNEIKPHTRWAKNILIKSRIYGVFNEHRNFTCLLDADTF